MSVGQTEGKSVDLAPGQPDNSASVPPEESAPVSIVDEDKTVSYMQNAERSQGVQVLLPDRHIVRAEEVTDKDTFLKYLNTELGALVEQKSAASGKLKYARSKEKQDMARMAVVAAGCIAVILAGVFTFGLAGVVVAVVASAFVLATNLADLPSAKAPGLQKELDDNTFKERLSTVTEVLFQNFDDDSIPPEQYGGIAKKMHGFLDSEKTHERIEQLVEAIGLQRNFDLRTNNEDSLKAKHKDRVAGFSQKIITELFDTIDSFLDDDTKAKISEQKRDLLGNLPEDFGEKFLSPIFDSLAIDKDKTEDDGGKNLYDITVAGFKEGIKQYEKTLPVVDKIEVDKDSGGQSKPEDTP